MSRGHEYQPHVAPVLDGDPSQWNRAQRRESAKRITSEARAALRREKKIAAKSVDASTDANNSSLANNAGENTARIVTAGFTLATFGSGIADVQIAVAQPAKAALVQPDLYNLNNTEIPSTSFGQLDTSKVITPAGIAGITDVISTKATIQPESAPNANPKVVSNVSGPLKEVVLPVKNIKKPNLSELDKDVSKIAAKQLKNLAKHSKGSAEFMQVSDQYQNSGFFATLKHKKGKTYEVASGNKVEQASWKKVDSTTWALEANHVKKPLIKVVSAIKGVAQNLSVTLNANGETVKTKAVDNNSSQADNLASILSGTIPLQPDEVISTPSPTPKPSSTPEPSPTPTANALSLPQTPHKPGESYKLIVIPAGINNSPAPSQSEIQQIFTGSGDSQSGMESVQQFYRNEGVNLTITVSNQISVPTTVFQNVDTCDTVPETIAELKFFQQQ